MSEEHPNARLAKILWQSVANGDAEALRSTFAPNVVWEVCGKHRFAGRHRGVDAIIDYFAQLGEGAEELTLDLGTVYPNEDGMVVVYHMRARRGIHRLDTDVLLEIEVRNHQIANVRSVPVDQDALADFWSGGAGG